MVLERVFGRILHRNQLSPKHIFALFSFIFTLWAFYRYFPGLLPEWVEELVLKSVIWLMPTFWLVRKVENQPFSSLGLTGKNIKKSLFWACGLGLVFALEGFLANLTRYQKASPPDFISWSFGAAVLLSFVTSFSEEIVFRGYVFNRLWHLWRKEWLANIVSSLLYVLIYLPMGIFVLGYNPGVMLAYLFFVFVFGFGSAFVFARTGNILSSILLHVFWSWPILLFR